MKFSVFVVLSCLCICLNSAKSVTITNWGNVNGRTLGTENVVVESSFLQIKTYNVIYPKVFFTLRLKYYMWNRKLNIYKYVECTLQSRAMWWIQRVRNIILIVQCIKFQNCEMVFYIITLFCAKRFINHTEIVCFSNHQASLLLA